MIRGQSVILKISLLFGICLLCACSKRPVAKDIPEEINMGTPAGDETPHVHKNPDGLWLALTDFSTVGKLSRLDLKTGKITHNVLNTGTDVAIYPDSVTSYEGLFLLTRMQSDSITVLKGRGAEIVANKALPDAINPQAVIRDAEQRVWWVGQESNHVEVLTPDLKQAVAHFDLTSFADPGDGLAELSSLTLIGTGQVAVTAQRLNRGMQIWVPEPLSGLAWINTQTLTYEKRQLVPVVNPISAFSTGPGLLSLVGAGDLSLSDKTRMGSVFRANGVNEADFRSTPSNALILDSSFAWDGKRAWIEWMPDQEKSCVHFEDRTLVCDSGNGGYIFNRLTLVNNTVYVSYIMERNAQLWVIPTLGDDVASRIQKVALPMQTQSLSLGP